jgi:hypothetical protein
VSKLAEPGPVQDRIRAALEASHAELGGSLRKALGSLMATIVQMCPSDAMLDEAETYFHDLVAAAKAFRSLNESGPRRKE